MNITRHNYEEYFILYMDNELGSDDRHRVELFVQENPDLKEELDWLQQSRFIPDSSVVFDAKEKLIRFSSSEKINITNYEEWLLLYIDNELTAQQRISVEEFLAGHPSAKTELGILQKTKLQPEQEIIFAKKESLHRREEKVRIVAFRRWKIAVAAALLLSISTAAFFFVANKGGKQEGIASEKLYDKKSTPVNTPEESPNNTIVTDPVIAKSNEVIKEERPANNSIAAKEKKTISSNNKNDQQLISSTKPDTRLPIDNKTETLKTNNLPQPIYNPNINKIAEEKLIAKADPQREDTLTKNDKIKEDPDVTRNNTQPLKNVVAVADIDQPSKKNKLRGFFRKVTRTLEKRTNIKTTDDEDRLLLAGFAVKL